MIRYEKIFILLKEKGYNKQYLRENMSSNAVNWLTKNKDIKLSTVNKLCNLLDCKPEDFLEYIPDQDEQESSED